MITNNAQVITKNICEGIFTVATEFIVDIVEIVMYGLSVIIIVPVIVLYEIVDNALFCVAS